MNNLSVVVGLEANVPKDDIVLGFLPPTVRKHTEFADEPDSTADQFEAAPRLARHVS